MEKKIALGNNEESSESVWSSGGTPAPPGQDTAGRVDLSYCVPVTWRVVLGLFLSGFWDSQGMTKTLTRHWGRAKMFQTDAQPQTRYVRKARKPTYHVPLVQQPSRVHRPLPPLPSTWSTGRSPKFAENNGDGVKTIDRIGQERRVGGRGEWCGPLALSSSSKFPLSSL